MKGIMTALVLLFCDVSLQAHPMGNFSINHYAGLSMNRSGIAIHYIIDMAEIPTFQQMSGLDLNGDQRISADESAQYARAQAVKFKQGLSLSLNGRRLPLLPTGSDLRLVPGAGGLPTLLVSAEYLVPWQLDLVQEKNRIEYIDENFVERIGWKEIVVRPNEAMPIIESNVSSKDRSRQLTEYPTDPTSSAPQEMQAGIVFSLSPAVIAGLEPLSGKPLPSLTVPPARKTFFLSAAGVWSKRDDSFTRLISSKDPVGEIIFLSLLIAFGLGAMHALSPGHGKTIVAGYLIGSRGTAAHALFLGAVVTLTHTLGVFALGLITLYGSRTVLPERLYPWLSFISGISIFVIGVTLFRKRMLALRHKHSHERGYHHHGRDHDHHHHHDHHHDDHDHGHSHLPVDPMSGAITLRSLLTVGISGGALPCPSALVVLLSAISLHRLGLGLLLIVAFSLGLALVLTTIGLLLVYASHITKRFEKHSGLLYRTPVVSSLVISVLGLAIALKALF